MKNKKHPVATPVVAVKPVVTVKVYPHVAQVFTNETELVGRRIIFGRPDDSQAFEKLISDLTSEVGSVEVLHFDANGNPAQK